MLLAFGFGGERTFPSASDSIVRATESYYLLILDSDERNDLDIVWAERACCGRDNRGVCKKHARNQK